MNHITDTEQPFDDSGAISAEWYAALSGFPLPPGHGMSADEINAFVDRAVGTYITKVFERTRNPDFS